jgi:hypothetical protein
MNSTLHFHLRPYPFQTLGDWWFQPAHVSFRTCPRLPRLLEGLPELRIESPDTEMFRVFLELT